MGASDLFVNSYLASKMSSFCVANLRNNLLLRAIRALKELIGSVLHASPEGVRRRDAPNNLKILDRNLLRPE